MTNHPKFTASHDSAARSVGYEGAKESRKGKNMEQRVCGYKMAEGICEARIHESATSYTGWEHDEETSWLHFATTEVTKHPHFLKCAACGKLPSDNAQHFLLEGGHRFINEEVLRLGKPERESK